MEIKIAICDDEKEVCTKIEQLLTEVLSSRKENFEIDIFLSGESLCKELEEQKYDLIFLDIELPKISGIDVGRYMREILRDEMVQIAYISGKTEYALELFEYRPINFLIKPIEKSAIEKVINKYLLIASQHQYFFEYKKKTDYYRVALSDICYFESVKRKIMICTRRHREQSNLKKVYPAQKSFYHSGEGHNGNEFYECNEFYDSLGHVYEQIKGNHFLWIHKSVLINYYYIRKISYDSVVMLDGTTFSISQARRKEIRRQYLEIRKEEL